MLALENLTPFAADRAIQQDRNGAKVWVVVVRGTFNITAGGELQIAEVQEPVRLVPEHLGDPSKTSLCYDSDIVITKPTTDVVLLGRAHAPGGRPVTDMLVSMAVGTVQKTLRVTGERTFVDSVAGPGFSDPRPFIHMPLIYEMAHGGAGEPSNPLGRGCPLDRRSLKGQPAPTILYPESNERNPAGFGPIPRHWSPRRGFAGTHDSRWQEERYPLPPEDLDPRFFLCSPEDQRPLSHLRGGDAVMLRHLTPTGLLRFLLPYLTLSFVTDFSGDEVKHDATLHTVILEPDYPRVQMVWQTSLHCQQRGHQLRRTVIEAPAQQLKSYTGQ